jgi:rare lipoprotein A
LRFDPRRLRRAAAFALLPAFAASTSIAIAATGGTPVAHISSADPVVSFGERAALGGIVSSRDGTGVALKFRPNGVDQWTLVRRIHTDANGRYRTRVRVSRTGSWRAVPRRGRASQDERIKVRAMSSFHTSRHDARRGNPVRLHGQVRPGGRRAIRVLIRGAGHDSVRAVTDRRGLYSVRWTPPHEGRYRLRVVSAKNARALGDRSPSRLVTAFRPAVASYYGPGFYGGALACGGTLQPDTIGVAHKTMPCGTKLTLRYGGRSVRVRVIDRGPYVAGREFDLTEATKNRLRFPSTGVVWSSK